MATSAWGKPAQGAWAAAVEDEEKEHGPIQAPVVSAPVVPEDDFPTLGMAATVKESKKEKKKKQTMSLGAFFTSSVGGAPSRSSDVDVLALPTAPRQRAEGEERPERPLGGAFGGYGGGREGGRPRFGDRDDEERPRRGEREDMGPSRADMASDWGAERKFAPSDSYGGDRGRGGFGGGFREREGGFQDRDGSRDRRGYEEGPSRADTTDNWGANKAFVPSTSGRGGGFEDRGRTGGSFGERRSFRDGSREGREGGGFRESFREPSRADIEDRWAHRGDAKPTGFDDRPRREPDEDRPPRRGFGDRWGGDGEGARDSSQDRWARTGPPAAEDGAPRERPRLNLAPRTSTAEGAAPAPAAGASRSSVFGAARPREEVLREQGRDPAKEEAAREEQQAAAEHMVPAAGPAVDRPESREEKELKQQIVDLQVRVAAGEAEAQVDTEEEGGEAPTVAAALQQLETQLAKLQLELDHKTRTEEGEREGGRSGRPSPEAASSWRRSEAPSGGDRPREGPRGERERGGFWGREERGERSSSFRDTRSTDREGSRAREERGPRGPSSRDADRPPRREGGW